MSDDEDDVIRTAMLIERDEQRENNQSNFEFEYKDELSDENNDNYNNTQEDDEESDKNNDQIDDIDCDLNSFHQQKYDNHVNIDNEDVVNEDEDQDNDNNKDLEVIDESENIESEIDNEDDSKNDYEIDKEDNENDDDDNDSNAEEIVILSNENSDNDDVDEEEDEEEDEDEDEQNNAAKKAEDLNIKSFIANILLDSKKTKKTVDRASSMYNKTDQTSFLNNILERNDRKFSKNKSTKTSNKKYKTNTFQRKFISDTAKYGLTEKPTLRLKTTINKKYDELNEQEKQASLVFSKRFGQKGFETLENKNEEQLSDESKNSISNQEYREQQKQQDDRQSTKISGSDINETYFFENTNKEKDLTNNYFDQWKNAIGANESYHSRIGNTDKNDRNNEYNDKTPVTITDINLIHEKIHLKNYIDKKYPKDPVDSDNNLDVCSHHSCINEKYKCIVSLQPNVELKKIGESFFVLLLFLFLKILTLYFTF